MKYGLIGEKLSHSFSPLIHSRLAEYEYSLKEISRSDIDTFMKEADFCGINVTIPYKQAIIPYLDSIDDNAKAIGAVNTVVKQNGKLLGYNTDFDGMCALIKRSGIDIKGKSVFILGTGGTSKTAAAVAMHLGASEIIKVSRKASESAISYDLLPSLRDKVEIIINTTPCGMYPDISGIPVEPSDYPSLCGVIDVIYNPISSLLVTRARSAGIKAVGGLYMLVAQAAFAAEKFLGTSIPEKKIEEIYSEILCFKQNLVLIGMPGCGKTTLGKMLSEATEKVFLDTDQLITESEQKEIPQIFAKGGEALFRSIEANIIKEKIAPQSSKIIATGGGAILRSENVDHLKQNGILIFIDRPIEKLVTTSTRPLTSTREALYAKYNERYKIYKQVADISVFCDGSIPESLAKITAAIASYRDDLIRKD